MTEQSFASLVGANVRRFRTARGMTQTELADRVAEGFESGVYRQQTIVKIEKGTRAIRLSEALVIAHALGVEIADLYRPDDEARQVERISSLLSELAHGCDDARNRLAAVEALRVKLKKLLEGAAAEGLPEDLARSATAMTSENLLEVVVEEARKLSERML